jgi:NAD(P)H-dependent FMN reductase
MDDDKDDKVVIAVICGTIRATRESIKAAQWVADQGRRLDDVEIIFVDPREFDLPGDGNKDPDSRDPRFTEITEKADAFFIVTPEYNHGYPGSLKRLLDSEYANYKHKAAVVAGVSDGPWGGARVCEALLPVLHTVGLSVAQPNVYFPKVQDLFDSQGSLKQEYVDQYTKSVRGAYKDLIWTAKALQWGRDNLTW